VCIPTRARGHSKGCSSIVSAPRAQTRLDRPSVLVLGGSPTLAAQVAGCIDEHFRAPCASRCSSVAGLDHVNIHALDLVLCDDTLPDADGFGALQQLLERRESLPVVMMTGVHDAARAAEAIRRGAADFVLRTPEILTVVPMVVEKNLEAERIRAENRRLQAALAASLSELKRKNRELADAAARYEALATTDALTGLANRRRLKEQLHVMFSEAVRYGHDLSCLMIDLDGFKSINDSLGHQAGDELLALAGRIVDEQVRVSDLAARYGGDEFVVILPHTGSEVAAGLAHRLRAAFQRRSEPNLTARERRMHIGMSVGVASISVSRPLDARQLIAHADAALYAAKGVSAPGVMLCNPDGRTARPIDQMAA